MVRECREIIGVVCVEQSRSRQSSGPLLNKTQKQGHDSLQMTLGSPGQYDSSDRQHALRDSPASE